MTDLKSLLEHAAGENPAITDDDLAADLRRGQRTVRRRQFTAAVAGVAATVVDIGGGWALLPQRDRSGIPSEPGVAASPGPGLPRARTPVPLVADGIRREGANIVCALQPKGWTVKVMKGSSAVNPGPIGGAPLSMSDPNVKHPIDGVDYLTVSPAGFHDGNGSPANHGEKFVPKYDKTWEDFLHYRAGPYQAVVNHTPDSERLPLTASGEHQIHMKVGENALIEVWAVTPRLGWDLETALKFAGSCRPVG